MLGCEARREGVLVNRDDIIRIAREAGFITDEADFIYPPKTPRRGIGLEIERVIVLAAAEKERQMIRDGYRQCANGQRTTQFCGLLDAAVKAEREACAKLFDGEVWAYDYREIAAAIRARSE